MTDRAPTRSRAGRGVSMPEAMRAIPDRARVAVASLCAVPTALIAGMCEARDRWSRIELVTDYLIEPLDAFEHPGEPFHSVSLQPSRAVGAMREANALQTVAASYSQFAGLMAPGAPLAVDVALVQVSPPGPDGRFSLGVLAGAVAEVVATAPLVIAEVNPRMPYTHGASELQRDEIDLLVDVDHPLVEMVVPAPSAIATAIGGHAAGEIPDGSVLQLGIGSIPEAILAALADHRDLGLHSGMISDAVVDLVEAGVMRGPLTTSAIIGSSRSFEWAHRNDRVRMVASATSHGIAALSRIENFVAINSALEVAGDGSINAEMAAGRVLSGPGGQPDYAAGAFAAPGGRSIIALPSTAARGSVSRIVDEFAAGTSVTVPRYLVDRIVTEHGVARLRGVAIENRPDALAAIADPAFRGSLTGGRWAQSVERSRSDQG